MGNLAEAGPRFRAAAQNHPEALLEEPQAFQAVGEKNCPLEVEIYWKDRNPFETGCLS